MTNTKHTKRTILASIVAIIVCFATLLGTTFAWFTDSTSSNGNIIASGKLDVNAYWMDATKDPTNADNWVEFNGEPIFNYSKWEPGYVEAKHLKVTNEGSLAFKFKLAIEPNGAVSKLADVIEVYYFANATKLTDSNDLANGVKVGTLAEMIADPDGAAYGVLLPKGAEPNKINEVKESVAVTIAFALPKDISNEYQNLSIGTNFDINIYATQYDYESDSFGNDFDKDAEYDIPVKVSKWDGTASIDWYLKDKNAQSFTLAKAEDLAGLAVLVDGADESDIVALGLDESEWDGMPVNFEGKTVKLDSNVDLYVEDENGEPISFEPVGSFSDNEAFKGTFDGQGYTVSNLYQNGWALQNGYWDGPEYGMGFFSLVEDAVIKNINFDGASLPSEANIMGVVAGGAANCVFENINITNAYLGNHSWYSGGAIGWAEKDIKLINCDIDANSVVSSQWGDFNNANGGLIGGIDSTSTIYLKDCDVACVIDAYNDVTSAYEWYSYRSCGMLIGDTAQLDDPDGDNVGNAIAPNLTCENVTVTYGDWANYHYCEFGSSNYPFCRVEAGESTGAYGNARVNEYSDANGNKVVDNNHVHNNGEKHNELIVFDQLYGGESGDRYCTYGTATHAGVTVIYNNKAK